VHVLNMFLYFMFFCPRCACLVKAWDRKNTSTTRALPDYW